VKKEYAVEFENVSLVRNGTKILNNISMTVAANESIAIIGPNGSGKTSLMKLFKGDSRAYSDERTKCRLFGEERWNIFELRKRMGVVSTDLQSRFNDPTSAGEVILSGFFRTMNVHKDHTVTEEMIKAVEKAAELMGISDKLTRDIGKLSLGEKRRTLIARALVPDPKMLVLDEPMTGLDIVVKNEFKSMFDSLIDNGTSVVMITHDLDDIPKNIDRIIMMKDGAIFRDGGKKELLTSDIVSELFSANVKITEENGMYRMTTQ